MQEVVEQFGFEAIIPTSLDASISLTQTFIVFMITIFVNLYTIIKIKNIQPSKAMRA